jgi:hypothetical protein
LFIDVALVSKITQSSDIVACIQSIASQQPSTTTQAEDQAEDMEGDIVGLAKRVITAIQNGGEKQQGEPHDDKQR